MSSELDLIRAFRAEDAAVEAESLAAARVLLLAHIETSAAGEQAAPRRARRRVVVGRIRMDAVAAFVSVLVVVAVGVVILSVGGQRHARPAIRHTVHTTGGPPVIRNYWPGKLPPLAGQVVCNANLARPGAIAGVGGSPSGMFVVTATQINGVNESPFSITAKGLAPNTNKGVYAVWLEPAVTQASGGYVLVKPTRPRLLGVIEPGVGPDGRFAAEGRVPAAQDGTYLLLVTLQPGASAKTAGRTVLKGFVTL